MHANIKEDAVDGIAEAGRDPSGGCSAEETFKVGYAVGHKQNIERSPCMMRLSQVHGRDVPFRAC